MPRSKTGKALTGARPKTHGNFAEGAAITQGVMKLIMGGVKWERMNAAKKEALHMIVHKIHRIVTGDPNHLDHWNDIAGYADCAIKDDEALPKKKKRKVKSPSLKTARPAKKEVVAPAPVAKKAAAKKAAKKKVKARPARKVNRPVVLPTEPAQASRPSRRRAARTAAPVADAPAPVPAASPEAA